MPETGSEATRGSNPVPGMRCPYPRCDEVINLEGEVGECTYCREPLHACQKCRAVNRAMARFCQACGAAVEYPPFRPERLIQKHKALTRPARLVGIPNPVWVPPLSYRGYLWLLSSGGQLYRLSAQASEAVPIVMLGDGFGRCASVIREVAVSPESDLIDPWLVTASSHEVKAVSLISGRVRTLATADSGDRILADTLEKYWCLDVDPSRVYFLRRSSEAVSLMTVQFTTGEAHSYDLPTEDIIGPFRCGDLTFAYSATELFSLGPLGLRAHPFPAGFHAWTKPGAGEVRPGLGRLPFLVSGRTVYIPGTYARRPCFLVLRATGGMSESAIVPLPQETTYRQDSAGRPVLCTQGRIVLLEGSATREVAADPEISPRRVAFASGDLSVAFVEPTGGQRLRFFCRGATSDCPMKELPHFFECTEYCGIGTSLLMVYLTGSEQTEVAIWHAQ
jgi:hypothetical protein